MCDEAIDRLTAGMAAGDEAAVDRFYRRYFDWLYAQARRWSGRDEAFCLDVVQDAVIRIIRTVRRADTEAQFHAWMRLVVQTTALDRLRGEQRRTARENAMVTVTPSFAATDDDGGAFDETRESWLREQVARFDPQLVRMIELRYTHAWTLARIAEALGLSIGTIDGRLRRAIRELRSRATEAFDD